MLSVENEGCGKILAADMLDEVLEDLPPLGEVEEDEDSFLDNDEDMEDEDDAPVPDGQLHGVGPVSAPAPAPPTAAGQLHGVGPTPASTAAAFKTTTAAKTPPTPSGIIIGSPFAPCLSHWLSAKLFVGRLS